LPTTLSCKPINVPNDVYVAQPVEIAFEVTNNGNETVEYVVFIAYCNGYSNCQKYYLAWASKPIYIEPGKTEKVEFKVVFKQAGYYGIGVYDHTNKGFACGWIIQVLQQGQPPSQPGQPGQPGNWLGIIGQIMQLLPTLIAIPLVISIVSMLSNAIKNIG